MKTNTQIINYDTTTVEGTVEMTEVQCFFGSKMMKIEDSIVIDDKSIQYSMDPTSYQYYDSSSAINETQYIVHLNDLKNNNQQVSILQQSNTTLQVNTNWQFQIDLQYILAQYLYYQIKSARSFKGIKNTNTLTTTVDSSINKYIGINIMNRYSFDHINFYVKYINLQTGQNPVGTVQLQYNPTWDITLRNPQYLIANPNVISDTLDISNPLVLNYKQTQPSTMYKFNYYFDLFYVRS